MVGFHAWWFELADASIFNPALIRHASLKMFSGSLHNDESCTCLVVVQVVDLHSIQTLPQFMWLV